MAEKNSSAVQGTVIQTAMAPTFTNFAKLPLEMQMKIWKHAIPAPRLIRAHLRMGDDDEIRFTTNASVPALLSACYTSRKIILEVYSTCTESERGRFGWMGETMYSSFSDWSGAQDYQAFFHEPKA